MTRKYTILFGIMISATLLLFAASHYPAGSPYGKSSVGHAPTMPAQLRKASAEQGRQQSVAKPLTLNATYLVTLIIKNFYLQEMN